MSFNYGLSIINGKPSIPYRFVGSFFERTLGNAPKLKNLLKCFWTVLQSERWYEN